MKSVTLKDVAKAAGVSYATVSRALSGSPQIGSDTRERIIKLCDEMGYTTNYVARSMVMKKTDLIGLVVPSIDNAFMSELAYYAEMSARSHGYNVMLCNSGPDLKQEKTVVKLLLGRQVDGILIVPQSPKTYENIRAYTDQVPTVFLSENLRDQPQSYVAVDNSRGTYIGTKSKRHISHSTQQQTYCHMIPGIHPVGNKTVQESRQAIYQAYHCHYHAKAGLRNTILCRQTGNGKREILSHEIKQCIAYHRGYYCSGLPIFEQLGS